MRNLQRGITCAIWTRLLGMNSTNVAARPRSTSPPHKKPRLLGAEDEKTPHPLAAGASSSIEVRPAPKQSKKGKKNKRPPLPEPCSPEDVNLRDVYSILGSEVVERATNSGAEYAAPIALCAEIELTILDITSHGKGDYFVFAWYYAELAL